MNQGSKLMGVMSGVVMVGGCLMGRRLFFGSWQVGVSWVIGWVWPWRVGSAMAGGFGHGRYALGGGC